MAFITKKTRLFNYLSPIAMYHDNKSANKKIMGLLDYQSTLIEEYMKNYNSHNIALELPTGSGKTLVGLVIGDYRRRKNNEKVLFLCPTNQLVHQVVEHANNKYGLKAIAFCGKQADYSQKDTTDYLRAQAIGVTSYSSFFIENTFFNNPDIIIMDDVHSSESYITDTWSVEISNDDSLFQVLAEFLKDYISDASYQKLTYKEQNNMDYGWCNIVPIGLIKDKINSLQTIIDAGVQTCSNKSSKYSWQRLRENIQDCTIYIEEGRILIRPWIAPTKTHLPFANAKQRILMSATLGHSGELERITGLSKITKLPIVNDWDKNGVGRKFFIIPSISEAKFEEAKIMLELHKISKKSVVLVPNHNYENNIKSIMTNFSSETELFSARDIENSKLRFIQSSDAMVVMANRFDGVDFPDDECRMLIIIDLPKVANIQEKFLATRMGSNILYSERIKTRIIQAVGRCTRNTRDSSVVCILGNSIIKNLIEPQNLKAFAPELRAELEFGIDNSLNYKSIEEIISNVSSFFEANDEWKEAEEDIVGRKKEFIEEDVKTLAALSKLGECSVLEVKYQYAIWKHNYVEAFDFVAQIIAKLNMQSLNGYRSYWNYIGGTLAYYLLQEGRTEYKVKGMKMFQEILKDNISIKWVVDLEKTLFDSNVVTSGVDDYLGDIILQFEHILSGYTTKRKLENTIQNILNELNGVGDDAGKKFEEGHKLLGELLGYISKNDNSSGAPDPYWIIGDNLCIVAEDKIYEKDKKITLEHIRQAKSHEAWVRKNEPLVSKDTKIYTVIISNATNAEKEAEHLMNDLYYIHRDTFNDWANKSLNSVRKVYNTFLSEGDVEWRDATINEFRTNNITPLDFLNLALSTPIKEII